MMIFVKVPISNLQYCHNIITKYLVKNTSVIQFYFAGLAFIKRFWGFGDILRFQIIQIYTVCHTYPKKNVLMLF